MIGDILVVLTATGAAGVAVASSRRAIQRHWAASARIVASHDAVARLNLKAGVEAVYEQVQSDLEKVTAEAAGLPYLPIVGLRIAKSDYPEINVAVAISFLRKHLDSAGEDEVQRVLPMLQYLEQKALERAAELHPPIDMDPAIPT